TVEALAGPAPLVRPVAPASLPPLPALALDVLDGVTSLADKSLLLQEGPGDPPWFTMLEMIREYGLEQLAACGEEAAARGRPALVYLALAEQAEPALRGADQTGWLDRLEREHDNLRAALRWAVDVPDGEIAQRLGGALWRFWWVRGHVSEGQAWLAAAL